MVVLLKYIWHIWNLTTISVYYLCQTCTLDIFHHFSCTYLHLYDQDYSNQTAASYTSSSSNLRILDFRTESRFLYMIACSNRSLDNDVFFHLRITAEGMMSRFLYMITYSSRSLDNDVFFPLKITVEGMMSRFLNIIACSNRSLDNVLIHLKVTTEGMMSRFFCT